MCGWEEIGREYKVVMLMVGRVVVQGGEWGMGARV